MTRPPDTTTSGSVLIEALMALVLIAIAGLVVASAAAASLRATRRAATLGAVTALAARELSARAADAAGAASAVTTLIVPGLAGPVTCTTAVHRDDALVTIAVGIDGGRPLERVSLTTRVQVDP